MRLYSLVNFFLHCFPYPVLPAQPLTSPLPSPLFFDPLVSTCLGLSNCSSTRRIFVREKGSKRRQQSQKQSLVLQLWIPHEDQAKLLYISVGSPGLSHTCFLGGVSVSVNPYGPSLIDSVGFLVLSLTFLAPSILPSTLP